jgi:type VI secretion system protein ImpJ
MSDNNRIVWSEGLFLQPQHFQQQERYLESYVQGRAAALRAYSWGFTQLEIERDLLTIGKLALRRACGVFPDGTPFAMPDNDPLPPPLEVGAQMRDQLVQLAIPLASASAAMAARGNGGAEITRYRAREHQARDVMSGAAAVTSLEVAALSAQLMQQSESGEGYAQIPLAQVIECRADKRVLLDENFIPTVMNCAAAPPLATFLSWLQGVLHQRGEALAARAVASGRGGAAEIADFLMLQAINRYEPVLIHLAATGHCHPEELYRLGLEIAGDLATLTTRARRPVSFAAYRHDALRASFEPLIQALRDSLSVETPDTAVAIPIKYKDFGISIATVADRTLFDSANFVLAARADLPTEEFRRRVMDQLKIGPVEKIRDLVNLALPGIPVQSLPVVPRQIPFHAGFAYFELQRSGPLWKSLKASGGIAIHQSGEFPGLAMEMWAIRSTS